MPFPGPLSSLPVLTVEIAVAHDQQQDPFDEADDRGEEGPAKKKIGDAPADPAQIELVDAEAAEEERQERRDQPASAARRRGNIDARRRHLADAAFRADLRQRL